MRSVKVVIGLLTYRRPQMLRRALESLRHLNIPDSVSVAAVVIDNNPDRSALPIVAAWAAGSGVGSARGAGMPLTAVHEPRRGIASARNRLIEAALERGADAIAFFDDDEILHPDWLVRLLDAHAAFGAD